jgi:hypothetical protein
MGKHFLFEDREYKIAPRWQRRRGGPDSAETLSRMRPRRRRAGGGGGAIRKTDARQKCIVKTHYSDSMKAHEKQIKEYLAREGTDIDGSCAKLYGTDREEYKANMSARNFRIFISPQKGKEMDLEELTRTFEKKLEMDSGYKFYWQGANHYNTAHPHAHLLINGVDRNGREVRFSPDMIKTFMRENARDICTRRLGIRTEREMRMERDGLLRAARWTKFDEQIKGNSYEGKVNLDALPMKERIRYMERLDYLRGLGLCKFERGVYKLEQDWEETLRNAGRYETYLDARKSSPNLRMYRGEEGTISGTVKKIYKLDEDANENNAMVIEGKDGKSYYVPLYRQARMKRGGKWRAVEEGNRIRIVAHKNEKGRLSPNIYEEKKQGVSL